MSSTLIRALAFLAALALVTSPAHADAVRVVEGDTIKAGEITYRLFGIDAPEAGQECVKAGGGTWACGKLATQRMEYSVVGREIECDERGQDEYGRVLAVCRVDGQELNSLLVTEGLAWAFDVIPRYMELSRTRLVLPASASGNQTPKPLGTIAPDVWTVAVQKAPGGCPSKGNINWQSERIYHAPWSAEGENLRTNLLRYLGCARWSCLYTVCTKAAVCWARRPLV